MGRVLAYTNIDLSTGILPLREQQECMARQFGPGDFSPKASINAGCAYVEHEPLSQRKYPRAVCHSDQMQECSSEACLEGPTILPALFLSVQCLGLDGPPSWSVSMLHVSMLSSRYMTTLPDSIRSYNDHISFCQTSALDLSVFPRHYCHSNHLYPYRLLAI